jgi:hypothetical protein
VAIDFGGTPLFARVDTDGRITRIDARNTTVKTITEQVTDVDIAAIAKAWNAAKPAGPPSPRDTARGTIAGAMVAVDYGRPSKRGREIFGSLITLDSTWRVGANAATQLTMSAPLRIGDSDIPAGTYSLWMIPSIGTSKLMINKQHGQWGTQYDAAQDLAVIPMTTKRLNVPVDQLTIVIEGSGDSGALKVRWDDREFSVPMRKP